MGEKDPGSHTIPTNFPPFGCLIFLHFLALLVRRHFTARFPYVQCITTFPLNASVNANASVNVSAHMNAHCSFG